MAVGYRKLVTRNTLLDYARIVTDLFSVVADRGSGRQGFFLPGSRMPVANPTAANRRWFDPILIPPWNLRDEVAGQVCVGRDGGGRTVMAVSDVEQR